MTNQSDETKIAVLNQKVDDLRDDVREVRNLVASKIATREYVDNRIDPIKKLVYWGLGIMGTVVGGTLLILIGLVINK